MATGSDNFTTDTLGTDWAVQTGESTGSVAGGVWRAENFTGGHRRTAETYTADQYSEGTVTSLTGLARISVRVRCAAAAQTYYAGGADPNDEGNSLYRIWKLVAGTYASVAVHASQTPAVSDVVRLSVTGSTLTLSVNGTVILTQADVSIATGQPGFGGGAATPPQSQWDTWSAADVGGPRVLSASPLTYTWAVAAVSLGSPGVGADNFTSDQLAADWAVQTGELTGAVIAGTWNSNGTDCGHYRTRETYANNHSSQARITNLTTQYNISVRVRCQAGARSYYAGGSAPNDSGSSVYRIWKWVNGSWTSIVNHASQVPVVGDVMTLSVTGTTLSFVVNGVEILSTTDGALTGGAPGLGGGAVVFPTSLLDDWVGTGGGAAGPKVLTASPLTYTWTVAPTGSAAHVPEMPRVFVDTTYAQPGGTVTAVNAGANLQTAINNANPGDVLVLQAGAMFTGNFTLPSKAGSTYIYLISSALTSLPVGVRVAPSQAGLMPKIVSTNTTPALQGDAHAHHYRFAGIEIATTYALTAATHFNVVALEINAGATVLSDLPHHIIFDRCYIHGTTTGNVRRGLLMNGIHIGLVDSYVEECHEIGGDSQAVAAWNGPGPYKIVNNFLSAACEVTLFGGIDSKGATFVPADVECRNNYLTKPLKWKVDDPSYAKIHWSVKNIFELKSVQRAWVDNNTFENNWGDAQNGYGILFTPRNQDGTAPWSVVQDVIFTHNLIRHSGGGLNILGTDNLQTSLPTERILVQHNQWQDIDGAVWNGTGSWIQVGDGGDDITIDHNTALQTGFPIVFTRNVAIRPSVRFTFTNNICNYGGGFFGDYGVGNDNLAFATYAPGIVFRRNALIAGNPANLPADNLYPASSSAVGFVNLATFDLRLAVASPYNNAALDGFDVGVVFPSQSPFVLTALPLLYGWAVSPATLTRTTRNTLAANPLAYTWAVSPVTLSRTLPGSNSRRLTLTKPFRVIKSVLLTLQNAPGETAVTVKVMDLQANPGPNGGPLIEARNSAGVLVPAHVHAQIDGY